MLPKFLNKEPGIDMDDRNTKAVAYTCNTKESIPEDLSLPRKSNDVLGLNESIKRTINFFNIHGKAVKIFSNQRIIFWPVKMTASVLKHSLWKLIFLTIGNSRDQNHNNFIIYAVYAIWIWHQATIICGKATILIFSEGIG
jgi:hypothetical protein